MSRRVTLISALGATLLGAAAVPAAAAVPSPVVTRVTPLDATIGETLTISGRHFNAGQAKNTVVFHRSGAKPVFVKAAQASKTELKVVLSAKLLPFLASRSGTPSATRFRLRVLARRFGKSFTKQGLSPRIGPPREEGSSPSITGPSPAAPAAGPKEAAPPAATPVVVAEAPKTAPSPAPDPCANPAPAPADADGDRLHDEKECRTFRTDPTKADSDGDTMTDGWEIVASMDLNEIDPDAQNDPNVPRDWDAFQLPYPAKRPFPNALDGGDGGSDHDGDGLSALDEFRFWNGPGAQAAQARDRFPRLSYSDGLQRSEIEAIPAGWEHLNYGVPRDSVLTDDERDFDRDGLGNWAEIRGFMLPDWWPAVHRSPQPEPVYQWRQFQQPDPLDADSDGDSLPDGLDDQDQDGYTNIAEYRPGHRGLWVNPFNPCVPSPHSPSCSRYFPIGAGDDELWSPFWVCPDHDLWLVPPFAGGPFGSELPASARSDDSCPGARYGTPLLAIRRIPAALTAGNGGTNRSFGSMGRIAGLVRRSARPFSARARQLTS